MQCLKGMENVDINKEFNSCPEGKQIIANNFHKTMNTLQALLSQLNMMYYWERLKDFFIDFDDIPTFEQLRKLYSRCLRLYQIIDAFMKIFKMIEIKNKIDNKLELNPTDEILKDTN